MLYFEVKINSISNPDNTDNCRVNADLRFYDDAKNIVQELRAVEFIPVMLGEMSRRLGAVVFTDNPSVSDSEMKVLWDLQVNVLTCDLNTSPKESFFHKHIDTLYALGLLSKDAI